MTTRRRAEDAVTAAAAVPAETSPVLTREERAERAAARRRGRTAQLSPLEQMRPFRANSVPDKSAGAYYLRPQGATIMDVLIWYPNGAQHDRQYDPKGHYSENSEYYQARQRRKRYEYVGPTLTVAGARRMVEIILANRDAELERLEDEIAECELVIQNSDRPEVRDMQRKRRAQLEARMARVSQQIDPEALVAELSEIARAQRMARVDPAVLAVMREMLAEQSAQFGALVAHFQRTNAGQADPAMEQGVATIG